MDGLAFATLAVLILVLVSQVALWAVLYQVVKQQGRFLLRLEQLTERPVWAGHGPLPGELPVVPAPPQPAGLPVGAAVAPFQLPDLTGRRVGLDDFRGQALLLVHWSPQCGFCDLIAPDLAQLQPALREHKVQLLLVSYGDAESNRKLAEEHGLRCPILLLDDAPPVAAFDGLGTPVAYLLDEQGRVARPLAIGADQVSALAGAVVAEPATSRRRLPGERPLSESRIEREGLKAGTAAPTFTLPDVHGRTVSLEDYRGRRVLLVFTDPHCGPCDALAPELVRLDQAHRDNGLALLMIGRGDAEENRQKAEQHGLRFPVALQKRWEVSRAYGIFATPVGFLIDEQGVIAADVAMGAEAILGLAQGQLADGGAGREQANGRALR